MVPTAALPTGIGPLGVHRTQQPGQVGAIGSLMPTGTPYPSSPGVSGRAQQCLVTTTDLFQPPPLWQRSRSLTPHTAGRQESGLVRVLCQVLFILFPQKHLVRGQLLGGSHDTAAGVVRHGTARYGTVRGSLRVAQSTADTHTVTMFRGSAPGIALTAGYGAQPRSALGLCSPPAPRPV